MQTSVGLQQCKSCLTPRMRTCRARRAFSVSNAASTSAKQAVQDDQVELGKTGLPYYCSQSLSLEVCSTLVERHQFVVFVTVSRRALHNLQASK